MDTLKDRIIRARAPLKRIGLENRDFSILANNCWGGIVSRDRRLPYNSPTCGTYFFSKDYLRFLSDVHRYLETELEELPVRESRYAEELISLHGEEVVLGQMDDVEVVLLHYPTFAEAKEKWDRRKKRIRWDNLLVKYSDQNGFAPEDFETFRQLDFANKLFLTTNPAYASGFTCLIPDRWQQGCAVDDIKSSFRVMNVNDVLNRMIRGNND
jgi:uncharacterized protein (DUF1919 family)